MPRPVCIHTNTGRSEDVCNCGCPETAFLFISYRSLQFHWHSSVTSPIFSRLSKRASRQKPLRIPLKPQKYSRTHGLIINSLTVLLHELKSCAKSRSRTVLRSRSRSDWLLYIFATDLFSFEATSLRFSIPVAHPEPASRFPRALLA